MPMFSVKFSAEYSVEEVAVEDGAAAMVAVELEIVNAITRWRIDTCTNCPNEPAREITRVIPRRIFLLLSRRSPRNCAANILWAITQRPQRRPASDDRSKCA